MFPLLNLEPFINILALNFLHHEVNILFVIICLEEFYDSFMVKRPQNWKLLKKIFYVLILLKFFLVDCFDNHLLVLIEQTMCQKHLAVGTST